MPVNRDQLDFLLQKLESLLKRQREFVTEIYALREEINQLRSAAGNDQQEEKRDCRTACREGY